MAGQASSKRRILIVDDDATVREILSRYLVREGYDVDRAADGEAALDRTQTHPPDLILLDLMLPGISGLDVCRRVRRSTGVPIIMLTARGEENERVFGLRLGADDYVVKPFSPREVTARVTSVLRRANGTAKNEVESIAAGELELDLRARTATMAGEPVQLTVREFDLLAFLARHPGRVFRRRELLEEVWGYAVGDTATVTVHVRRLRAKLERDAGQPRQIETVWGIGYRFQA
jgi:two-component system, OmpR family, response regulator ResD